MAAVKFKPAGTECVNPRDISSSLRESDDWTHSSTSATMRLLNVAGRIATSSTVPISRPAATACSFLVRSLPDTLRYENQLIVAEDDCVTAHGRFSGSGRPAAWIAADIVRIENGKLSEPSDVLGRLRGITRHRGRPGDCYGQKRVGLPPILQSFLRAPP